MAMPRAASAPPAGSVPGGAGRRTRDPSRYRRVRSAREGQCRSRFGAPGRRRPRRARCAACPVRAGCDNDELRRGSDFSRPDPRRAFATVAASSWVYIDMGAPVPARRRRPSSMETSGRWRQGQRSHRVAWARAAGRSFDPETGDSAPENWKMATEGGGRHSPSTFVWEEEGVPVFCRCPRTDELGPKVTDFAHRPPGCAELPACGHAHASLRKCGDDEGPQRRGRRGPGPAGRLDRFRARSGQPRHISHCARRGRRLAGPPSWRSAVPELLRRVHQARRLLSLRLLRPGRAGAALDGAPGGTGARGLPTDRADPGQVRPADHGGAGRTT